MEEWWRHSTLQYILQIMDRLLFFYKILLFSTCVSIKYTINLRKYLSLRSFKNSTLNNFFTNTFSEYSDFLMKIYIGSTNFFRTLHSSLDTPDLIRKKKYCKMFMTTCSAIDASLFLLSWRVPCSNHLKGYQSLKM